MRRFQQGFSLIDSMTAMFVVMMGTLTLLSLSTMSSKVSGQSEIRSVALHIGKQKLEGLRELAEQNRAPITDKVFTIASELKAQFAEQVKLTGTYSIGPYSNRGDLTQITVKIYWQNDSSEKTTSINGARSRLFLSTVIATQPLNISYSGVYENLPPPAGGGAPSGSTSSSSSGGSIGWIPPESETESEPESEPSTSEGGTSTGGSSGGGTTGEEIGGCTYTYGPC